MLNELHAVALGTATVRSARFHECVVTIHEKTLPLSISRTVARPTSPAPFYEKVFASCWAGRDDGVLVGTKMNNLYRWDLTTNALHALPLPRCPNTNTSSEYVVQHDSARGIHDIDFSPACGLVVTAGGTRSRDAVVLDSGLVPRWLLAGHRDSVFAAKFICADVIATAARDSAVLLWKLPLDASVSTTQTVQESIEQIERVESVDVNGLSAVQTLRHTVRRHEHGDERVRCLEVCGDLICTASVKQASGSLVLWDKHSLNVVRRVALPANDELAAMATDGAHMVAIGNRHGVSVFDVRTSRCVLCNLRIASDNTGVRSITYRGSSVVFASGQGGVAVAEGTGALRAVGGVAVRRTEEGTVDTSSPGYTLADTHLQAVYTMKFSPIGTRFIVGGGQLLVLSLDVTSVASPLFFVVRDCLCVIPLLYCFMFCILCRLLARCCVVYVCRTRRRACVWHCVNDDISQSISAPPSAASCVRGTVAQNTIAWCHFASLTPHSVALHHTSLRLRENLPVVCAAR